MEFKTDQLREAASVVGNFVGKRSPIELHKAVMIRQAPTGMFLEAGSQDGSVQVFLSGEGPGQRHDVAVPHGSFSSLAATLGGEFTEVEATHNSLNVRSGGTEASIAALDASGWFIKSDDFACNEMIQFPIKEANNCSQKVAFACVNSDVHFASAITIRVSGGRMQFLAGSSKVGAAAWCDGVDGEFLALVPPFSVYGAMQCLSYSEGDDALIGHNGENVIMSSDNVLLKLPVVAQGRICKDADSLRDIVSTGNRWLVSRNDVAEFCRQAAAVGNEHSTAVCCTPNGNSLTLDYSGVCYSDRSHDVGVTCKRTIAGKCDGDKVHISNTLLKRIISGACEENFSLWQGDRFMGVTSSNTHIAVAGLLAPPKQEG